MSNDYFEQFKGQLRYMCLDKLYALRRTFRAFGDKEKVLVVEAEIERKKKEYE